LFVPIQNLQALGIGELFHPSHPLGDRPVSDIVQRAGWRVPAGCRTCEDQSDQHYGVSGLNFALCRGS
jgi:hypothetical protein